MPPRPGAVLVIETSEARGDDLLSGTRIVEKRPFRYEVGGVLLARPGLA